MFEERASQLSNSAFIVVTYYLSVCPIPEEAAAFKLFELHIHVGGDSYTYLQICIFSTKYSFILIIYLLNCDTIVKHFNLLTSFLFYCC